MGVEVSWFESKTGDQTIPGVHMSSKRDYSRERQRRLQTEGKKGEQERAQAQRNAKKEGIRKTGDGSDAGHKKSRKSGGSSNSSNLKKQSRSSNRSHGGKIGNKAGKRLGGQRSSRKGVKNGSTKS